MTAGSTARAGSRSPHARRRAVLAAERRKGRQPRRAELTTLWRDLLAGRRSVVDRFEHDGRCYLVLRREPAASRSQAGLSPRQRQVAAYVARGESNKAIAHRLGLAVPTVANHVRRLKAALGVGTRAALVTLLCHLPVEAADPPERA